MHRDALLMAAGLGQRSVALRCVARKVRPDLTRLPWLSRRALLSTYRLGHQGSPHHGLPNTPLAILPACPTAPNLANLTAELEATTWMPDESFSLPESRVGCRLSTPNGARDLHCSPPGGFVTAAARPWTISTPLTEN